MRQMIKNVASADLLHTASRLPRRAFLALIPGVVFAQGWTNPKTDVAPDALDVDPGSQEWVCPMDPDIRSDKPGKCPRCGMTLVKGIVERIEYPMRIETSSKVVRAGVPVKLIFDVEDPKTLKTVTDFTIVHERKFHLFLISQDMTFFMHEHPTIRPDLRYEFEVTFPKPGFYRVLADVYPTAGTPQLIEKTLFVQGPGFKLEQAKLSEDLSLQQGANLAGKMTSGPFHRPIAGRKTTLFLRLTPNDGIQPYLGAMAHMLAASSDLIDLIHEHPVSDNDFGGPENGGYKELTFNIYFPRPGVYRLWLNLQRKGVVNTIAFNMPVLTDEEVPE